jgi:hypothetical protein
MNKSIMMASAAPLLVLAGCGETAEDPVATAAVTPAAEANAAPAAATAAAAPAEVPAAGTPPTKEFIVGKWGEVGDCELAIDFKADGTMDGPFDGWTWDGKDLTMPPNPAKMTLTVVDAKTMESRREGDKPRKLTRC